jgi:uncharacterized protein (DUF1800 family)
MPRRPVRTPALAVLAWSALAAAAAIPLPAAAALGTAVEFYYGALGHYFLTANPAEAALLDAGNVTKGWRRTGGEFTVYSDPGPDRQAVCRFFGRPGIGPPSHFYTADPAECEWVKTLPAWQFENIAFYVQVPVAGACPAGTTPIYRSFYSDGVADANHRFTVDLTAAARMPNRPGWVPEGIVMCSPLSDADREADAVRLLEQASLGPTESAVAEVKAKGAAAWIDEQLAMNVTKYTQYPAWDPPMDPTLCMNDDTPPVTPEKYCAMNKWSPTPVGMEFFRQAKAAPDQLRVRMAHAWHQIFVVSSSGGVGETYANAEFQQRLRDNAFGTFENLLLKYALSPQLGRFQNWVYNVPEHNGIRPNENFARELMQLFTIGVNRLNEDGSAIIDANGKWVPTYAQSDIESLARVLTGYSMPTKPGKVPDFWRNGNYYLGDMIAFDEYHDQGSKNLMNGSLVLFPGGGADKDFRTAIRFLVNHPNTPPFIAKQLIQKTVTSAPTPGYVYRVAQAFKDNGAGVRGDLGAVTRAILLDPEARGARKIDSTYGRLREPALFWTSMIRALDVATDGWVPYSMGWQSQQVLFNAPTVFNYYPSDYVLPGTTVPAPEFGIYTSAEFLNRANLVNDLLYSVDQRAVAPDWNSWWLAQPFVYNATGTMSPALAAFLPDAANPAALVARLDRLFLHRTMTAAMRGTIVNAVTKLPANDPLRRVKMAVNLILVSVDYQVQK